MATVITFNSLYNILRKEINSTPLQELPSDFFNALEQFFSEKKSQLQRLEQNMNTNTTEEDITQHKKEKRKLQSAKALAKDLCEKRFQKISKHAIDTVLHSHEARISLMLHEEKQIFKNIQDSLLAIGTLKTLD